MFNMIKILGHSIEGDKVQVRCSEIDPTGARRGDFNIEVAAYNPDNTPRSTEEVAADVETAIKSRHLYATGRGAPVVKLPEFIEIDAEPAHGRR